MKKSTAKILAASIIGTTGLIVGGLLALPKILRVAGLDPEYEGEPFNFAGKKALIITTSHGVLVESQKRTGVYASEMTVPYYEFLGANMEVDLASVKGGIIPIEKASLEYPVVTEADKRYMNDRVFLNKRYNSMRVENTDFLAYDIIFIAGGWGAAYDLGYNVKLAKKLTEANAHGKILGSVCHGALGFIQVKGVDGEPLVKGRKVTAVSDKQIKQLGIIETSLHPETEMRKLGAKYLKDTSVFEVFSNLTVVDGNLVTGQNQNAAKETAQKMMKLLEMKDIQI